MNITKDMSVDNKARFIYTGRYQNSLTRESYTNTPMFKDFQSLKLFAIIQTPGCFIDVYREAKAVQYRSNYGRRYYCQRYQRNSSRIGKYVLYIHARFLFANFK